MAFSEKVKETVKEILEGFFSTLHSMFDIVSHNAFKTAMGGKFFGSIPFQSKEAIALRAGIKKQMETSPSNAGDIAQIALEVGMLEMGKTSLEYITDTIIDADQPITSRGVNSMLALREITALTGGLAIVGEAVPTTQLGQIGMEIRKVLEQSGIYSLPGNWYNTVWQTAVAPRMTIELAKKYRPQITPLDVAQKMYLRGKLGTQGYEHLLEQYGYKSGDIDYIKQSAWVYPSAQDVIRFAVRDVYNPERVKAGDLDADYPLEGEQDAIKAGVLPDHFKQYWRAHWELPSPSMGYEMLHRGYLTKDELKGLLRAADYAPGYVDKMIAIAYSPLTRVDARNMYGLGVLDDDGYLDAIKSLGYSPANAELLLKYAKAQKMGAAKDLTQTNMLEAYDLGLVTRQDTVTYLTKSGYDDSEATLILDLRDRKAKQTLIREQLDTLKAQLKAGQIDTNMFVTKLAKLGLPQTTAEREQATILESLKQSIAKPSKTDILDWYKAKQIVKERAQSELRGLGYSEEYIKLYLGETIKA